MVCDFATIKEKLGTLDGVQLTYVGDCENNVTYDLMRGCALLGMRCRVGCPSADGYKPVEEVMKECAALNAKYGGETLVMHDAGAAVDGADVVYCDSWMSYHIDAGQRAARLAALEPFRVDSALFARSSARSIFMNCLPACRGEEQTADVIDGPRSVVYDQAGNRLWSAMAVLDFLVRGRE